MGVGKKSANRMAASARISQINAEAAQRFSAEGLSGWDKVASSLVVAKLWRDAGFSPEQYKEFLSVADPQADPVMPGEWAAWRDEMGDEFSFRAAKTKIHRVFPRPMRTR